MSWLERYCEGERVAVWRDMRSAGGLDQSLRPQAVAVAIETMRRCLGNLELLLPRLQREGWPGHLRVPPQDLSELARLEERTGGPLPPSLLAFWTVVGSVDLTGDHHRDEPVPDFGTGLDFAELDPLVVSDPRCDEELWAEEGPPYELDLAPDALHKADISGGPAYGVVLPFAGADPLFANEPHALPFVDYLRLALHWGGFPSLEDHAALPAVQHLLRHLTAGFQEF